MRRDFFPDREVDMLWWTANLRAKLLIDPSAYGVSIERAEQYALLQEAFSLAYHHAVGGKSGHAATAAKNEARKAIEKESRQIVKLIAGAADPSSAVRIDLGMNVRKQRVRRLGTPLSAPRVMIHSASGRNVQISLIDADRPHSRARPDEAAGATLLMFVGDEWPAEESAWNLYGNTSKTTLTMTFPNSVPAFARVWIRAFWFGTRCEPSAPSVPVFTHVGYGMGTPTAYIARAA